MGVSCGIVGLPNVGKSTLFNALTAAAAERGNYEFCTIEPNVAVVEVPDRNLDRIHDLIATDRVVPTSVRIVDIAGLIEGASKGEGMGNQFLANIRECDAIMQVVRCFGGDKVVRSRPVDPVRDIEIIELELALADLETVEKAVERVGRKARSGDKESVLQKDVYERAAALLRKGTFLRREAWKAEEESALRPLCLLTMKRILYVANVADDDLEGRSAYVERVAAYAEARGCTWVPICADIECELRSMQDGDRREMMAALGLERMGLERLIQATYGLLGLQTYYTAGEKEIRAWTVEKGTSAPKAAGVIHSDFEKKFIRAEVYSIADLEQFRTEAALRAAGKLRTEGRDYVMRPEDVVHFLIGR